MGPHLVRSWFSNTNYMLMTLKVIPLVLASPLTPGVHNPGADSNRHLPPNLFKLYSSPSLCLRLHLPLHSLSHLSQLTKWQIHPPLYVGQNPWKELSKSYSTPLSYACIQIYLFYLQNRTRMQAFLTTPTTYTQVLAVILFTQRPQGQLPISLRAKHRSP